MRMVIGGKLDNFNVYLFIVTGKNQTSFNKKVGMKGILRVDMIKHERARNIEDMRGRQENQPK